MGNKAIENEFLKVYDQYSDHVLRYAYYKIYDYELAKELTQEAFMRAWKYLADGQEVQNLKSLVYKILRNLIIDHFRSRDGQVESIEQLMEKGFIIPDKNDQVEAMRNNVDVKLALKFIYQLEEDHREVIFMRYIHGLKPREIAEILDKSPNSISVAINRAIKKIKEIIKNYESEKNIQNF